jgi:hypothetical protein
MPLPVPAAVGGSEVTVPSTIASETVPLPLDNTLTNTPDAFIPVAPFVPSQPASSYAGFIPPAQQGPSLESDTAIPDWVLSPDPDEQNNMVIGIGSAKASSDQVSIQMAEARARQDIAFQLNAQIKAQITDYAENEGSGSEYDLSQTSVTERIGQQLTNIELKGVKVAKRERDRNGTWWVKVTWSKDQANKTASVLTQNIIEVAPTPTPAEKAVEAVRLMDEQLEKANLKSAVMSE